MAIMGTDKTGDTEEVRIDHMGRLVVTHDEGMAVAVQTFRGKPLEVVSEAINTALADAYAYLVTVVDTISDVYTALTQSIRTEEINPANQWYINEDINVANGADATFDYYYDFDSYSKGGFQLALDCDAGTVTATCWMSIEDNPAPAAAAYQDVTNDAFGVVSLISAAAPAEDIWIDDAGIFGSARWVRIRIVAATGATTGDWRIDHKRLWV